MSEGYVIYLLWDPRNGDIRYVGQTKDPQRRFHDHQAGTGRQTHCRNWERSLVKQRLCCEVAVVDDGLALDVANVRERWWIAYARQWGWPLTNDTDGGGGTLGYKHSPEAVEKLREREPSPETREKIRQALLGRKHSPEAREKMHGRKHSPEEIEKMRQANLGRKHSPESREKMRQALLGRTVSPEAVEKMRQAKLRRLPQYIEIGL